jgi:hypothetical protein
MLTRRSGRITSLALLAVIGCGQGDPANPSPTTEPAAPAEAPAPAPAATQPAPLPAPSTDATLRALHLSSGDLVPAFDPKVTEYTSTELGSHDPIDVTP